MKTLKREWQNIIIAVEMIVLGFLLCLLVASLLARADRAQDSAESSVSKEPHIVAVYPTVINASADTTNAPDDALSSETEPIEETSSEDASETVDAAQRRYLDVPLSVDLQDYIYDLCDQSDVPFELVVAVIDAESSFRADVISASDDYGLMQINKIGHAELTEKLGVRDYLDPFQNVRAGVYILQRNLESTDGDVVAALMQYNCGPAGARRLWREGVHSTAYTDKIMRLYNNYKETK